MPANTSEYNKRYYEANREKLLANSRKKYVLDAQYAENQKQRSKESRLRAQRRKPSSKKKKPRAANRPAGPRWYKLEIDGEEMAVRMYAIAHLAEKLERKTGTLHMWEQKGVLPRAMFRDTANRRMYTEDQITALVNAFINTRASGAGYRPLKELKKSFQAAWEKMPRGIKEKRRHAKEK